MPDVVLASAGSLFVALTALMAAAVYLYLACKTGCRWNAWVFVLSFATLCYSSAVFFQYNMAAVPLNRDVELVEYVALLLLIHALMGFTFSYLDRPSKWYHLTAVPFHLLLASVLCSTDLIVGHSFVYHDFPILVKPYIEPGKGPLNLPYMVYLVGSCFASVVLWARHARKENRDRSFFLAGFLVWIGFGIHDAFATMGMPGFLFILEYGFLGFTISVIGMSIGEYLEQMRMAEERSRETERLNRELEKRVAQRTRELRRIIDLVPHMIFIRDLEGSFLLTNQTNAEVFGTTVERMEGSRITDLPFCPPEVEYYLRQDREVVESGETRIFPEETFPLSDGRRLVLRTVKMPFRASESSKPAVLGVSIDITQIKLAEEALKASERRYRQLIENMPVCCFTFDRSGTILSWNRASEEIYGYSEHEAVGKTIHTLITTSETESETSKNIQEVFSGRTVKSVLWRDRNKAGDPGWRLGNEFPLFNPDGSVSCGVFVGMDVTRSKELEEQLRQSQKMEAVGRLAGGIAHDFNNLLTAILGYTEILERGLEGDLLSMVGEIRSAGRRAASLTQQLLAFGRKQVLQPRSLDLNCLVKGMLGMLRRIIGEHIHLQADVSPDPVQVEADPSQIEQLVMNLIVNARDAVESGGRIQLQTGYRDLDERFCSKIQDLQPGRYALLEVSDNGTGMDEQTLQRIFEPFFTTKEQGKGTGLGLATAFGVVKQSGGHITVSSKIGTGSTFQVYLPAAGAALDAAGEPGGQKQAEALGCGERVLVVEDEIMVREIICRALTKSGYQVTEAGSGGKAMMLLDQGYDLLITDMVMPGMSGTELAGAVHAVNPRLKVLYISGYTPELVPDRQDDAGDFNYLQKPFTPADLCRKVREVLDSPKKISSANRAAEPGRSTKSA